MNIEDFDGKMRVRSQKELERRITSIRKGDYRSFTLSHRKDGPLLCVQVRKQVAYLHYFPDPDYLVHAGYHATGMTPPGYKRPVRFRFAGEEDLTMPPDTLVSLADAVAAAKEFYKDPGLPHCIRWQEL